MMMLFDPSELTPADAPVSEKAEALVEVAQQIRLWQEGQSPPVSDNQMVKRFGALGSTKTYKKLREGDTLQLDVEDWLPKYRTVIQQILAEQEARVEEIYADMSGTEEVYRATLGLLQQTGINRILLVEGGSGAGKTQALRHTAGRLTGHVIYVEANEMWSSGWEAIGALCVATGAAKSREELPRYESDRVHLLKQRLKQRVTIAVDEAQHMSGPVLNTIKGLINETPSCFVIAAMDTLWTKLRRAHWQEAKQLIFNRLYKRIKLAGPTVEDVKLFFERRLKVSGGELLKTYRAIQAIATTHGGMAFLRNTATRCDELGKGEVDAGTLAEAASYVKKQVE